MYDLTVISLTQAGSERWAYRYNGPENHVDVVTALDFGAHRNIYAAGMSGMQFTVISLNPTSGIEECFKPQASSFKPTATIVSGILRMPAGSRQYTAYRAELLDISGRKVMELVPGENDVSGLAPGVYFVREYSALSSQHTGPSAVDVRKVIIAR